MLMRHAKSNWSESGQRDIDRRLAARGREVAPLMGRYIARHGLTPDKVLVSAAQRTRETWDLVAPALDRKPDVAIEARLYEASGKSVLPVLQETKPDVHTLLVIGHNPGLQELASLVTASGDVSARQNLLEKFPTAALAVIDVAIDRWIDLKPNLGRLDRFVTPRALTEEAD